MPTDNRRLPVPEGTRPIQIFTKKKERPKVTSERLDSRKAEDVRPVFLRVGIVSSAKGSAYLEMNRTKILCSVYGPREMTKRQDFSVNGKLNCDFKYAPYSCPVRRQHQQDSEEKELSLILKEALEPAVCLFKYPKSAIDVFVLVIENDGSSLSGAITCAGAALADAAIDMYDMVLGMAGKWTGNEWLLDPTLAEETPLYEENGLVTIGWMPSLQQISMQMQHGMLDPKTLSQGVKMLTESGERLHEVVQGCLLSSVSQIIKQEGESK